MEARFLTAVMSTIVMTATISAADAATYQTVNFVVTAERQELAEEVGQAAEAYRRQLATFWIGRPMPNWSRPCRLTVKEGPIGAGGQTTFQFDRGEVLNWRMFVQGSRERILDSVLPHEINHTIFACHFRRPLPRWADEGAATLFEHHSEQRKQLDLLNLVINDSSQCIPLKDLLAMKDYPKGKRPMLILYAQGFALVDFLVQQRGRSGYLKFLADGHEMGWDKAIRENFDHSGIESLEKNWKGWVLAGMPKLTLPREQMMAAQPAVETQDVARPQISPAATVPRSGKPRRPEVIRSQSPEPTQSSATRETRPASGAQNAPRRDFRHQSIIAPIPADNGNTTESADATKSVSENGILQSSVSAQPVSRTGGRFESTGLHQQPENSSTEPSLFDFGRDLSPSERVENSGLTPQWAGFPGQAKPF